MTFGFLVGSRNFCKLFWVSWEVFVLHGDDCNHCVAKSCTTTAYRWLLRDSLSSLRTLWSAVIKSPKFSALGTTALVRLLQEAIVIFVLKQISKFGCAYPSPILLLLATPKAIHEKNWESIEVVDNFYLPDFPWTPVANLAHLAIVHFVILRRLHFYLCFRFLLIHATGFPVTLHSYSHFFLLLDVSVVASILRWRCRRSWWRWSRRTCRWTKDNEWYMVRCVAIDVRAIFDEMWFLTTGPVVSIPMIFAELPEWKNCGCIFKNHHCHEDVQGLSCWPCACSRPESTTNSPSFSFMVDAAGIIHSWLGEWNVALSFSLSL